MQLSERTVALIAGALSACIALLALSGFAGGIVIFFLPLLPLYYVGIRHPAETNLAAITFCALMILVAGFNGAQFILFFLILPAWYLIRCSLAREDGQWRPMDVAIPPLAMYAATFFAVLLAFAGSEEGGIKAVTEAMIAESGAGMDADVVERLRFFVDRWLFLLFASVGWVWLSVVMLLGMFMRFMLTPQDPQERTRWSLVGMLPPVWYPALVAAAGLLQFAFTGDGVLYARTIFVILLFPYFTFGVTWVHSRFAQREGRALTLALFYAAMVVMYPGLPLILACMGLIQHIYVLARGSNAS